MHIGAYIRLKHIDSKNILLFIVIYCIELVLVRLYSAVGTHYS